MTRKTPTTPEPAAQSNLDGMFDSLLRLPSNCSKEAEVALFNRITQSLTAGTYLADLLSSRLAQWFAYQVSNDLNTDIMDVVDSLSRDLHKATAETTKVTLQAEAAGKRAAQDLANATTFAEGLARQLEAEEELVIDAKQAAEEWLTAYHEVHGELLATRDEVAALKLEVIKLKARLFDLTEAGRS